MATSVDHVSPYLHFPGTCEEAFNAYARILGGAIDTIMRVRDTPAAAQMPPDMIDKIMHASLSVGSFSLLGSDVPPDRYRKPQGMRVTLNIEDPAQGERVFDALAKGGTVDMPFGQTFWAKGFGMCTDRFDTPWMINCA